LLIDTPPELRLQLVAAGVATLDAVLFTHAHADHVHGIDDLRAISVRQGAALDVYGAAGTLAELERRFPYIFDHTPPQPGTSKPQLAARTLKPDCETEIAGMPVRALPLPHGTDTVLGYRVGSIAYLTDAKAVPEEARARHIPHASDARHAARRARGAPSRRHRAGLRRTGCRSRRGVGRTSRHPGLA